MKYLEFEFTYESAIENNVVNDVLAAELGEIGFDSFVENESGLLAYIPKKDYKAEALDEKLKAFPLPATKIDFTEREAEDKDWNEEWEKNYFKPIRIGHKCIIRASFHEHEPGYEYEIIIDPKMAFGTGNHETTYLMIEEIFKLDLEGKKVLDMGCGTAVLAILAKMRGAAEVVGIDIDEWAYENALENVKLNHSEEISIALGGAEKIEQFGQFDIIIANINRNILLNDMTKYAKALKPGGQLLMSGFYKEDLPIIEESCVMNGITLERSEEKNRWTVAITRKN